MNIPIQAAGSSTAPPGLTEGTSNSGYQTSGVRAVPLAKKHERKYIAPTARNTIRGKYPLARFLYVYVNKHPHKPRSPLEREFITLVLSRRGQQAVIEDGNIPLPARTD